MGSGLSRREQRLLSAALRQGTKPVSSSSWGAGVLAVIALIVIAGGYLSELWETRALGFDIVEGIGVAGILLAHVWLQLSYNRLRKVSFSVICHLANTAGLSNLHKEAEAQREQERE